jgi:hypothetical protein
MRKFYIFPDSSPWRLWRLILYPLKIDDTARYEKLEMKKSKKKKRKNRLLANVGFLCPWSTNPVSCFPPSTFTFFGPHLLFGGIKRNHGEIQQPCGGAFKWKIRISACLTQLSIPRSSWGGPNRRNQFFLHCPGIIS